jgi:hypothetical protein
MGVRTVFRLMIFSLMKKLRAGMYAITDANKSDGNRCSISNDPTRFDPSSLFRLLGSFPDHFIGYTDRRHRIREGEFVPGDLESRYSLNSFPIRKRTALNVVGHGLRPLIDRVGAEVGNAPCTTTFFFWSSRLAVIGDEFRLQSVG